ncbi:MAG: endo-1,4-beta-xylanase [Lentisphaeria bacterium]|nr:endo-1,4-beta-xylanase [Lentisphaeria bacterium]
MNKKELNFPWSFGCNFIPSTAINQLEMWQADTFDPETIDRELGWAAGIGMNLVRVYLHDLLWLDDKNGFLERMERFLEIASSHGIKAMFVFFDDCWRDEFKSGKQPAPIPYEHNSGWIQSPGVRAADDLSQRPRLEEYVKGVLTHFAHDTRIALWDLYNEPGNGKSGDHITKSGLRGVASMPLLRDVFRWAREVAPEQPLTAAPWAFGEDFDELNRFMFENSDVVTFHAYNPPAEMLERINFVRYIASGRPVICSEYMARTIGSTFASCLPLLRENNVGAINWGLVSGKTQTIYPWGWNKDKGVPTPYFHDVFHADGSFLHPEEGEFFKEFMAK